MKLLQVSPLGVLFFLAGCRHAPPPEPTGGSSFAFVEPPPAPPPPATSGEIKEVINRSQYNEARPIRPLVQPIYPPKALAAKAGWATVGVKITVDETGRVTDISPSMLTFTTPGRFADDFRAAVEVALRQWRFVPAEIQQIEPIQGLDEPANRVTHSEKVETTFDLSFTFTATGGVQLLPATGK